MKKNTGKDPSFQFYYKDWLADQRLLGLPKYAKGVWIDLMALSCDMPTPGIFWNGNGALNRREILNKLTGNRQENLKGFKILERKGILKRREDGTFYVKRIYEDMRLRGIRREAGKKGGNPRLLNQTVNQNPTPSSSTSSSTSSSNINKYTLQQAKDAAIMVGISEQQAEVWHNHFKAQGFIFANGQPIDDLQSALVRWRNNAHKFEESTPPQVDLETQSKQHKQKVREDYEPYLRAKNTQALKDLRKDKGAVTQIANWLIDEILAERSK